MKSKSVILTALIFAFVFILGSCNMGNNSKYNKMTDEELINEGASIAGKTFVELSANLQTAIGQGGIINALEYCKVKAEPLIDSLSQLNKVSIRRTSSKARNSDNQPTDYEQTALASYQNGFENKEELKPKIHTLEDGTKIFFSPIIINDFCLQCHGSIDKNIQGKDYEKIQELYPGDIAVGYAGGDLRGMWSISFMNK